MVSMKINSIMRSFKIKLAIFDFRRLAIAHKSKV